ncbi:hypothetical protein SYNPS1DRAFT_21937 [Syncephalis pseudoplumigaleata]|uniref:Ig-like domain-containing protein n=1 Tax=Syncephalis pseudoplumigaleata TaxID=1712513 RepID=A0A4P9Z1N3_9FUNG|nr:hypothetical protein SYNPS1DRAFT_21937 [Syncephalis pseudoplumigaleata]|eukprot:RKP26266.1 hypothetical protein SYNPS1DRAFT_21937 [Syncephalis pseudoplumigaleata]
MKLSAAIFAAAALLAIAAASVEAHPGFTKVPTPGATCTPGSEPTATLVCEPDGRA